MPINDPYSSKIDKIQVLINAAKCGFEIPPTLISNSNRIMKRFCKKKRSFIIKPIDNVEGVLINDTTYLQYTTRINQRVFDEKPLIVNCPTLIQYEISKEYEVRVFYLNKKIYPMAIFSQKDNQTSLDFRRYNNNNPNRTIPVKLPEAVKAKIIRLMKLMNINCGSIDLIKDTQGLYYFLEINPVGQFGMTSRPCNYQLEKLIAKTLIIHGRKKRKKSKQYES